MQNEAGVLLVSFLYSIYYVCLVQNNENFKRSLELCFPSRVLQKVCKTLVHHEGDGLRYGKYIIHQYMLGNVLARLQKVILRVDTKF